VRVTRSQKGGGFRMEGKDRSKGKKRGWSRGESADGLLRKKFRFTKKTSSQEGSIHASARENPPWVRELSTTCRRSTPGEGKDGASPLKLFTTTDHEGL